MSSYLDPSPDLSDVSLGLLRDLAETTSPQDRVSALVEMGLSRPQLAVAVGASSEAVGRWAAGRTPQPRHARMIDLVRYCSVLLLRRGFTGKEVTSWWVSANPAFDGGAPSDFSAADGPLVRAAAAELAMRRFDAEVAAADKALRDEDSGKAAPSDVVPGRRRRKATRERNEDRALVDR